MKFKKVKIGIAPLTWTNDDLPELGGHISFSQCIAEMVEAGYAGCEIGNKFPRDVKQLNAALQPLNLQIASQWFSAHFTTDEHYEKTLERFAEHLHFLKSLNASVIVVSEQGDSIQGKEVPLFSKHKPLYEGKTWQKIIAGLHALGEIAHQNDMKIVYHQHMGTAIQTEAELDFLMENTDPRFISLLLDTGHLIYADIDPVKIIKKYGERIKHVHLKDLRPHVLNQVKEENLSFLEGVKAGIFTVPGDGFIDFDKIFEALAGISYEGWFIVEAEQDPYKAHPLTYAKMGRDFIKQKTGL